MAIFKPEVSGIGGSNVGTYTPPTVDYSNFFSGIGATVGALIQSNNKGGSVSEGDKKAIALRDVTANLQKVREIESPTVRAANFKIAQQNALLEYPMYREDIKSLFGEFTGEVYQSTGVDPATIEQANTYKWAQNEGQSQVSVAIIKAKGDPLLADQFIKDAYLKDQLYKNQVSTAENEVKLLEADEKKKKILLGSKIRPYLQAKVDDLFSKDTSKEVIDTLTQEAISKNLDVPTYLLDALTVTVAQRKAEITNELNRLGIDPATENVDSYFKAADATITALTQNKDLIERSIKNKTGKEAAEAISRITNPVLREAALKGNPTVISEISLKDPRFDQDILNLSKAGIGAGGTETLPTVSVPSLSNGSVGDSAMSFSQQYQGLLPTQELQKLFTADASSKKSLIKLGFEDLKTYKYNPDLPEATEAAYKNIAGMYTLSLPDVDTSGDAVKSTNVSVLMGNKAFDTINNIRQTNPDLGNNLFNIMNTYSINSAVRLLDSFDTNMEVIKDTDMSPFVLEMDAKGNLNLAVNKAAVRYDTTLQKAMGSFRYETVQKGRGTQRQGVNVSPTVTDPMQVLENYTSIKNASSMGRPFGESSNRKMIADNIEALKVLAMQSRNIPQEIRNIKYDPIEIIRQRVKVVGEK